MKKILSLLLTFATLVSVISFSEIPVSAAMNHSISVKTDKFYTIKNVGSGKMLNVYGSRNTNNTNITVYSADGTKGQLFKFAKVGSNYTITPKCATNKVLNVYGSSSKQNSNVCLWGKTGHNTQSWIIQYNASKDGFIICSANNKNYVLAATGSRNSSNVCLKKYNANDKYQIWKSSGLKVTTKNNTTSDNIEASKWMWPCKTTSLSCDFGDTYYHASWTHRGIDIRAKYEDVYASKSGTVYQMGYNSSRGYWLVIDHGDGYYSAYQHLNKYYVKSGTYVNQGAVIAQSGNTGQGSGAHLHFEIMNLGKAGLANKYANNFSQFNKYINTNPQRLTTAGFRLNNGRYVSTFSDSKGINYIYK